MITDLSSQDVVRGYSDERETAGSERARLNWFHQPLCSHPQHLLEPPFV